MTLVVLALAWLGGMAAVALWGAAPWYGLAVGLLLAPAAYARWGRAAGLLTVVAAVAAFGGAWRLEGWLEGRDLTLADYIGDEVTLEGVIADEPDPGLTTTRYRVDVEVADGKDVTGAVLVTVGQFDEYLPGDEVRVEGTIDDVEPFGDFDYRGYLRRQGIVGTMLFPDVEVTGRAGGLWWKRAGAQGRLSLEEALQRSLPEPEASLAAGIGFGRDANLPNDVYEDFRDTGLAHIVAVSGANVTYVAAFVFLALTPLVGVRWATAPAALVVALYLVAAGLDWSVVRAGIMAIVFLAGGVLGRQQSGLAALGAAAVLMTAWAPGAAQEPGFQLSLAATAGLIVFGPWARWGIEAALEQMGVAGVLPGIVIQSAALSLAATLATLPIVWVTFGRVSLVGPAANLVVEPLFVVAFGLSLITALAGGVSPDLGWAVGLVAYYPLALVTWVAETGGGLPFAAVDVPRGDEDWAFVAVLLLAAAGWPAYRNLAPAREPAPRGPATRTVRRVGAGAALGGVVAAVVLLGMAEGRAPGRLEVAFLDVGQGDAILVTTPGGERVLIDGGPSGIEVARELSGEFAHWERDIQALVLTHPQQDHVAGLVAALARYDVGRVIDAGSSNTSIAFERYAEGAPERETVAAGGSFEVDGVEFEVVWPPAGYDVGALNDRSVVLLVTYGSVSLLLTGDIEAAPQRALLAAGVTADILKVPHHGSDTSLPAFVEGMDAAVAVISVGADNRFRHPGDGVLAALDGVRVFRTDLHGRVVVSTDGETIEVRTERDR